ncbi:glycosyltransferase family 39 protein [Pseudarthrobacter sp. TAF60_1]|uniref:glycosyltransferase family 39 protein n=1 Tax=Pseudarthrobacter sp. TAF60_1 TaxID=3233071 RepID=UPI003F9BE2D8
MIKVSRSAYVAALLTFVYSGFRVWVPSFWTDEAATLSAVRRSLPDLTSMLGNIDAVHGAYYFLMFGWTSIFGFSELAVRFPSLIAIAISASVMVELGRKISGVQFGLIAAALLVILPRTQYAATDGRSYALTVLGAVVSTYVLVSIRENATWAKWAVYSLAGALTVAVSFYTVLLLAAHALTVLLDPKLRLAWRGLVSASASWLVPAVYFGSAAIRQQFQIAWVPPVGPSFAFELAFMQFFSDGYFAIDGDVTPLPTPGEDFSMVVLAIVMWTAAVLGAVICRRHFIVRLAVPWLVIPAAVVIGGSIITGGNYYLPRYLTFLLPALALLAAAPARNWHGSWPPAKAGVVLAASVALLMSTPSYLGQRTQYGRDPQDDFRFIADSVKKLSRPSDAFIIGPAQSLAKQAYSESFEGLADPTRGITAAEWQRIFDQRFDVASSAARIRQYPTVILVEKSSESVMAEELQKLGYVPEENLRGPATTVTRYHLS